MWIVVPWPAGSPFDAATRAVADALGRELGQPCNVDNRPGASGAIGSTYVAKARPDGYTLVAASADTHSINPQVRSDLSYDAINGFTPLVVFGTISWMWMARSDFPANNIKELVALARQKPRLINYGTWGIGSTAHIAGALLESATGIEINHVPFQGGAPALSALLGGHINLMPYPPVQAADLRAAGKVKILGSTAKQRATGALSEVPTLAEQGIVGAESGSWYGIMAPKGLPDAVRAQLTQALLKVLGSADTLPRIRGAGIEPVVIHGPALAEFLRSEYQPYGSVIRQKQIKLS